MSHVLGIDSSTQSTKALLVEAETGRVVAERRAPHPPGTEVDPRAWLGAVDAAAGELLEKADAVAVGGQQHGMVLLDDSGEVLRDALLWNDVRSAPQARQLIEELGGPAESARRTGSVLVASITSTKLRWVADNEPDVAKRVAKVLLPHDYVSRHLSEDGAAFFTDRGDASGTGYFDPRSGTWDRELLEMALGHDAELPEIAPQPFARMARTRSGAIIAPGTGDNMAAALGLGLGPGDISVSIGTSGVCAMVSDKPAADASGMVTGFADATGRFLPLTCTINAAKILDFGCSLLGVDHAELARLALASVPGANGVTVLPYFDGERTPNRPDARATLTGVSTSTSREDIARALVEGLLLSLADGIAALEAATGVTGKRVVLIGGGAKSPAVRQLAADVWGREVSVAPEGEYVALGAARQAAQALHGDGLPAWQVAGAETFAPSRSAALDELRDAYASLRERTAGWV
ncbi:xylulokinase [Dermabacteraceae bacterium P13147]